MNEFEFKVIVYLKRIERFESSLKIATNIGIDPGIRCKNIKQILSKLVSRGLVEYVENFGYAWSQSKKAQTRDQRRIYS